MLPVRRSEKAVAVASLDEDVVFLDPAGDLHRLTKYDKHEVLVARAWPSPPPDVELRAGSEGVAESICAFVPGGGGRCFDLGDRDRGRAPASQEIAGPLHDLSAWPRCGLSPDLWCARADGTRVDHRSWEWVSAVSNGKDVNYTSIAAPPGTITLGGRGSDSLTVDGRPARCEDVRISEPGRKRCVLVADAPSFASASGQPAVVAGDDGDLLLADGRVVSVRDGVRHEVARNVVRMASDRNGTKIDRFGRVVVTPLSFEEGEAGAFGVLGRWTRLRARD
jgi:hypothetical protein